MQIKLKAKNLVLTSALKDYTEKKLSRIEKYFDHILSAQVMLSTQRNFHLVEVTVHVNGVTLRGEEKTENMYSSIDKVIDKLERQVLKMKEKLRNHHHVEEELPVGSATPKKPMPVFKRQKISSQTVEEASEAMSRLGSDFYLFQNAETGSVNLLLPDKKGKLTVIEPQMKR